MKKVFLTGAFTIAVFAFAFAQENKKGITYNYQATTESSLNELIKLTKGNSELYKEAITNIQKLERAGKIILSTEEFGPIKKRIDNSSKIPSTPKEIEEMHYADNASKMYVVITELLK